MQKEKILVTGGAGFIGSHFVDAALAAGYSVLTVDKLDYCGNLLNLEKALQNKSHKFLQADVADADAMLEAIKSFKPNAIVHLAAQTHVDRSIDDPSVFIENNVTATQKLLEVARTYWKAMRGARKESFRFIYVSTDEVYGSLQANDPPFALTSRYRPSSPYAASKAAGEMIALSYWRTFGFPVIVEHACNNYGPRQFPEKLIPLMIDRARSGLTLPLYGNGENIREWMYVTDHAAALLQIVKKGRAGATYNIGTGEEVPNIKLIRALCTLMDSACPGLLPHEEAITFVSDRPGHDFRYAMDSVDSERELGFAPKVRLIEGLHRTLQWYLENDDWLDSVKSGVYPDWVKRYGKL